MVLHKNQKQTAHFQQKTLFKKSLLAACIMAVGSVAYAQDAGKEDAVVEEVLVTGTRASLQNAQEIKRNSAVSVDAISASDIGALPDKSVLEALQRVPGIAMERYAGKFDPDHFSIEGSGVTLRGLSDQTRSEFNGRDTFSASNGRGLNFQDVSPELTGKVEVKKSQSANMIEGGIAGVINLNTRKPFDASGQQIAFSGSFDHGDLSEETRPSFSGLYSNRWDTGTGEFGVLVSFAKSRLASRTDGLSYGQIGYDRNGNGEVVGEVAVGDERVERNPLFGNAYAPINARVTTQDQERTRTGTSLATQWKNADDTILTTFEYVRSEARKDWIEHNFESDDKTFTSTSGVENNGFYVTRGTLNNIDSYTSTSRAQDNTRLVEDYSFNVEFTPNEKLTIKGDLQYVNAETKEEDLSIHAGVRASTEIDFRNLNDPKVRMIAPDNIANSRAYFIDPRNYYWRSAMDHLEDSEGEEFAIKLDAEYELDAGLLKSLETGVRFSDREQLVKWSKYNWGNLSENWAGAGRKYFSGLQDTNPWDGNIYNGAPYTGNLPYETFSNSNGHFGNTGGFVTGVAGGLVLVPNEDLVRDYSKFIAATNGIVIPGGFSARGNRADRFSPGEISDTNEQNQAVYAQLNFATEDEVLTGNVGLRVVRVELESAGGSTIPDNLRRMPDSMGAETNALLIEINTCPACVISSADDVTFANGPTNFSRSTVNNSYTKALPSFNLRFNLTDDIQSRFAISKAISFADIGNLRNFQAVSVSPILTRANPAAPLTAVAFNYTGQGGNPNLKPVESINVDTSVEWYFAEAGSLFAGIFLKDMSNFLGNTSVETPVTSNGVTRSVLIEKPINTGDARITGFEMGYQQFYDMLPAPFDGLGLQINLTLLDQSGDVPNSGIDSAQPPEVGSGGDSIKKPVFKNLPLQGLSDTTYNIILMYQKYDVDARLAYNWRSEYLLTSNDVITELPIFAQNSGQLDMSVFYNINDNLKIGIESSNLTNEITWTKMQVNTQGSVVPRNFFISDRRTALVLRGTF